MINIESWPLGIKIIFGLSPFLVGLTGLMMSAYIACSRDFLVLISAIQSNPWFESQKRSQGTSSFTSRWNLVYSAAGVLICPHLHIRRGLLDAEEFRRFPLPLKRRMLWSVWLTVIGFVWLMIGAGLVQASKY
ncbi:hypothetical protein ABE525_25280 [Pseudomonas wadenswilerensis]|uniref:Uncharacterized protein n=1 Tax=Pseudomonas wadenswilerensis TaxID=1785161 RepID=A0A380T2P5_9PSED|nr:hypothetical protein [Pseudomonas]MCE5984883.1 hypothetical protein [Pseudomonas sp. LF19]SPO66361.1 conserved membrane protein of unknown function [Pseudomonas sp. JV241A]SUQ63796.1 hypothetical protein CCOS864_03249 [Pseudomonas wadenswilerensis]